ncbi:MAG: redoxin domain-containing protein [Pirellulales bacterium]
MQTNSQLLRQRTWIAAIGILAFVWWSAASVSMLRAEDAKPADATSSETAVDKPADAKEVDAKELAAGHSQHGDAFNEGPRQHAYLMGGTGHVHIQVATENEEAQKFFDQGVGQLHGFWYYESERSFRQAAVLDPDCAMCYWGMAMSNVNNEKRARGFIAKAVERKAKASRREQTWIDAYAAFFDEKNKDNKRRREKLVLDLESIIHDFPDELEAKAFLAGQIWSNEGAGIAISSRQSVDALIQQVLDVEPMHPVHHYRIHMWDNPKPERALAAASLCGQSAPNIAHMWHMPGHIYSRLQRYEDAAWQQEASARVDHAHMIRDRVMPYQIHNYAHNNEWCSQNLSYVGRVHDAVTLAKNLLELPRHPQFNHYGVGGSAAAHGRRRLFEYLEKFELWDEVLALADTPYLEPTDQEDEQVRRLALVGAAHFSKEHFDAGQVCIEDLKSRIAAKQEAADKAEREAEEKAKNEKKNDDQIAKAKADARKPHERAKKPIEEALAELRGRRALARGDSKEALAQFEKAGRQVRKELLAQTHLKAGDAAKAIEIAKVSFDGAPGQVLPLANYVEVLYRGGKTDEAAEQFKKLRRLAGHADLDMPALARLSDAAKSMHLGDDWRDPASPANDVGVRPNLDSLGPFRWSPYVADDWTLTDGQNKPISLHQYRGKPVVVIFYLGYGCLHCVEQLKSFAPKTKDFSSEGIELVAISSDAQAELQQSIANCGIEGGFPFPLCSDASLNVFRQYRAFDDFEQTTLHGTFLIDAKGFVRWQDISYEPFNDPDFLLKEAERLLAQ